MMRQKNSHGGVFDKFNQENFLNTASDSMVDQELDDQDVASVTTTTTASKEEDENNTNFKGWLQLGIGDFNTSNSALLERDRSTLSELNLFHNTPSMSNNVQLPVVGNCSFDQLGRSSRSEVIRVLNHAPVILRPQVGLWFYLKAADNQEKQPFLPQIPKSFLRIKDGRMTIRLLVKYLVNKLDLQNESEVEIRCRGQELHPWLTLQQIRDTVWYTWPTSLRLINQPVMQDCVMTLHYSRTRDHRESTASKSMMQS